jgi:hypothetical protein
VKKSDKVIIKKLIKVDERERQMIDEADSMGCHNVRYYLPNKQVNEDKINDVGM